MRHAKACLNCEHPVQDNFCSHCGQKTDTHQITFKHFFFHDILHGIWHFEKGILFTIKQALLRPGKAALDYIAGKRIRYYNVFYLTLLLIGLNIFLTHIQSELSHHYFNTRLTPEANAPGKSIDAFISKNAKLIIFSFIPLFAINSFILFRRKKLNFSEHFIISGMMFAGVMIITTFGTLLYFTEYLNYIDFIVNVTNLLIPLSIIIYLIINYYKTFSDSYSRLQNSLRIFLFILLLLFEIFILITVMVGYFTSWKYELKLVY